MGGRRDMNTPPAADRRSSRLFLQDYALDEAVDVLAFGCWCPGRVVAVSAEHVTVDATYRGGEWEGAIYPAAQYRVVVSSPTSLRPRDLDAKPRRSSGVRRL